VHARQRKSPGVRSSLKRNGLQGHSTGEPAEVDLARLSYASIAHRGPCHRRRSRSSGTYAGAWRCSSVDPRRHFVAACSRRQAASTRRIGRCHVRSRIHAACHAVSPTLRLRDARPTLRRHTRRSQAVPVGRCRAARIAGHRVRRATALQAAPAAIDSRKCQRCGPAGSAHMGAPVQRARRASTPAKLPKPLADAAAPNPRRGASQSGAVRE
jgi:hypothetical protein